MNDFAIWDIVRNLLLAARWTALLSVVAFACGGMLALALLPMRISKKPALRRFTNAYVEVFQGTPLLMQLFLLFFGIALFGVDVPAWVAAGIALTLFSSAYLVEIWRGCVEAVARGQWEASSSLAMSYFEQLRHVILPQALRIAIAPTVGFSVQVVKGTAVTSVIGFVELTKAGAVISNATFQPFTVFGLVALMYFCLCFPLSAYARRLERKMNVTRTH
jgi:polar amino acid transport system permease protein